jgi:HEAT repeat protein
MTEKVFSTKAKLACVGVVVAACALALGLASSKGAAARLAKTVGLAQPVTDTQLGLIGSPEQIEATYDLKYDTRVVTITGQPLTTFELAGALTLVGVRIGRKAVVRGDFSGTLTSSAGANTDASKELERAAQQPFQLEFDNEGAFTRASGQPGTPPFIGRIWSALGEYLQVKGLAAESHWELQERDASGTYVATYDKQGTILSKRKLRYDLLSAKTLTSYEVVTSQAKFELDEQGGLAALDLSEGTRATLTAGSPLPGFEGMTHLKLTRSAVRSTKAAATLQGAQAFDEIAKVENQAARDNVMIGKLSLADALSEIEIFQRADATQEQKQRAGRAFAALTALLRRDPAAFVAVRANLLKGGPSTESLLAALRDASTPEAQKLLAELSGAKSPLTEDQRLEAARSLSRVATPNADTVRALKDLRADPIVGVQATYGLGTALHHLQDSDGELATGVRDELTHQLATSTDPAAQAAVLTSLGNAGDPTTTETIRRYVASPDPTVRAAAAQALRRIPGPDADAMLAALCGDAVPNVRYNAADAIGERAPSSVVTLAVSALALKETTLQVRAKAVNILAKWYPAEPTLAPTLQAVAAGDSNADLRNVAKGALAKS